MTTLPVDTSADIERVQIQLLRQMPVPRKLALMSQMGESVRALALAGLRQRYPNDTWEQRRRRLADLLLGPDLALEVYGPFPEDC